VHDDLVQPRVPSEGHDGATFGAFQSVIERDQLSPAVLHHVDCERPTCASCFVLDRGHLPGFGRDEGHAEHRTLRAAVNPCARVSIFAHKFLGVANDPESHIVVAILVVHAGQRIGQKPGTERRRDFDTLHRPDRYRQTVPRRGPPRLTDCEEDRTLRAVLVGMLREQDRGR
jgi:hypothetical protein